VLENVQFDGDAADVAVINALNFSGLTVKSAEFLDYGNFRSGYYSKSPNNIGPWIKAEFENGILPPNATGQRVVRLQDIRFDEGASNAVKLKNVSQFTASGLTVNVSGVDGSAGVFLDNVEYAELKLSRFGYTSNPRPAIKATNNSTVEIAGISVGGGVFTGEFDKTSRTIYNDQTCRGCVVQNVK
jgi:hypothetical protein